MRSGRKGFRAEGTVRVAISSGKGLATFEKHRGGQSRRGVGNRAQGRRGQGGSSGFF